MSLGSERGSARPLDQATLEPNEVHNSAVLTPKLWLARQVNPAKLTASWEIFGIPVKIRNDLGVVRPTRIWDRQHNGLVESERARLKEQPLVAGVLHLL